MHATHNLGYPRIGARRELKRAQEQYWRGDIDQSELRRVGADLRRRHWQAQADAGVDLVPVGDFAWYDQVLATTQMLGAVPERFLEHGDPDSLDTFFRMARGKSATGATVRPCELTKWFDTNYHYLVPEFSASTRLELNPDELLEQIVEARALGVTPKPVILGPVTWLWLGKPVEDGFDHRSLLPRVLPLYRQLLARLAEAGISWVQIDEPILATDLDEHWCTALREAYAALADAPVRRLVATYFAALEDNLALAAELPVDGLHVDLARAPHQLDEVHRALPADRVLSAGIVDGRNIWRADPAPLLEHLGTVAGERGERLWLAPSCSLLHVPMDKERESALEPAIKGALSFARQKLDELAVLRKALAEGHDAARADIEAAQAARQALAEAPGVRNPEVRQRMERIGERDAQRGSPWAERARQQRERLQLPLIPTTTIGSFPQTTEIRRTRRDFKAGRISETDYNEAMREEIARAIREQEALDLDVLVHGEAERNDMVEYFGEHLAGFAFTEGGWVQSYGSRCVKPPIIYGDVSRPSPMTVEWSRYAQSLTERPVKGMLTGPLTILQWSFPRDDQPRAETCRQIALALRDEVVDLEQAGIAVIQVDEPALREGLPLRRSGHAAYLDWAVESFRIAVSGVRDDTQIHTHMCYSEFNDILAGIAALDADVITIEASRSDMELLDGFERFAYPNEVGPGVYDIHAPRVPTEVEMRDLLRAATRVIPAERLWANPDCGLKTRRWDEVRPALANLVAAAKEVREKVAA